MTYAEAHVSQTIDQLLEEAGMTGSLQPHELDRLDQFHAGGMAAVDFLLTSLDLTSTHRVLDVGSGFGGPARRIAQATGALVHGVDMTESYVDAARALTDRCGLGDLVSYEHVDLASMSSGAQFDAAVTMHVQMNVEDKTAFFAAIHRRLAPGGRLALWDICTTGSAEFVWPMPWSIDGTDSHVATPDELRAAAEAAGFGIIEWTDETAWTNNWFATSFADGPPPGPALPMLLDDGFTRIINLAGALSDGTASIVRGILAKAE